MWKLGSNPFQNRFYFETKVMADSYDFQEWKIGKKRV